MTEFVLSDRSLSKLKGVNPELVEIVQQAIKLSEVDFGVSCGLRTKEEQADLVARGLSQTMKSKHLTGHAVDVFAFVSGKAIWDINYYFPLADAFKRAANLSGVMLRWGAAWEIPTGGTSSTNWLTYYQGTAQQAHEGYVDLRRGKGFKPFIDAPHFELPRK